MEKSEITGYVNDIHGEGLPGALVTLEGLTESVTLTTITSANGHYAFRELGPGKYKVTASMSGFKTSYQKVGLQMGENKEVDLTLDDDGVSEVG
ncbi:carboxypeptidase-like regulatory domain-containing protein [uncultured Kordia sp.]|uniref:carboxypeptidase-like regulatory domain-containing protein n=1 Tax=uncultured Kordia sp. TaxID=507699 RepID=UPI002606AD18|nr:carboxypeptidase-like regulatory domain-containing protein [uncultured Kordia sp.]